MRPGAKTLFDALHIIPGAKIGKFRFMQVSFVFRKVLRVEISFYASFKHS